MKILKSLPLAALVLFSVNCLAQNPASVWINTAEASSAFEKSWTSGENLVKANILGSGTLKAVRASSDDPFTFTVEKNRPTADLRQGDYWLISLPLENDLPKGSFVELDFTMVSQPNSPKYFVVEVLDGHRWKSNQMDLLTSQESSSLKYTIKCSGYGEGAIDQHVMCLQTFRLDNGAKGNVSFRIRAVGPYTCWGDEASPEDRNWSSFVDGPSSAIHIESYGTSAPKDTTRVLCIGNSFTYVNGPTWMLKDIAFSQGHFLDMKVAQKGGQTLGQHIHLGITSDAIERGPFDYVFLQDQSQSCPRVGKDSFRYQDIINNAGIIATWIRKKSPKASIFLERTWAYNGNNYGTFGSYKDFDAYAVKGSKKIAEAIGSGISPIGDAFAIVRAERPDITLLMSDNLHQTEFGAYLKACVNYLMLFGGDFDSNVTSCHLDPEKAAFLRKAAKRAVQPMN